MIYVYIFDLSIFGIGISLDFCNYETIEGIGMDPPLGKKVKILIFYITYMYI